MSSVYITGPVPSSKSRVVSIVWDMYDYVAGGLYPIILLLVVGHTVFNRAWTSNKIFLFSRPNTYPDGAIQNLNEIISSSRSRAWLTPALGKLYDACKEFIGYQ